MRKLPEANRAIIDVAKVRDYLLSPEHPVGRFKAAFFASVALRGRHRVARPPRRKRSTFRHSVSGVITMKFKELDTVVLDRDVPELGLRRGDLGAVVQVYPPDGLDVEFVTAAGRTQALAELRQTDLRAVGAEDLVAVRTLVRGAA